MKTALRLSLLVLIVLSSSTTLWAAPPDAASVANPLVGVWTGVVTEGEEKTTIRIEILEKGGVLKGAFSLPEAGAGDIAAGELLPLEGLVHNGHVVMFLIAIAGEVTPDSLLFVLETSSEALTGHLRELRKSTGTEGVWIPVRLERSK